MARIFNHFKTLGVYRDVDPKFLRERYLWLVKKHHPDRGGDNDVFTDVVAAYTTLSDRKLYSDYMKILLASCKICRACRGKGSTFRQVGFTNKEITACEPCGGAGFEV